MARMPRLIAPGFPIHLTQRCHNRELKFHDEMDFAHFREILMHASRSTSCAVHAYALMSNHIHLLLTASHPLGPSRLMQRVGSRFVRHWNTRHRRSGTLWDGRFHSMIVGSDRYFLACCRYIDLNPVRAGIVRHAVEYEWSSHRHLAHGGCDELLTSHGAYNALGMTPDARQAAYRAFCSADAPRREIEAIRAASLGCAAVGESRALRRLEAQLKRRVTPQQHGGDRRGVGWQNDHR